jgi:hypothetical protein
MPVPRMFHVIINKLARKIWIDTQMRILKWDKSFVYVSLLDPRIRTDTSKVPSPITTFVKDVVAIDIRIHRNKQIYPWIV